MRGFLLSILFFSSSVCMFFFFTDCCLNLIRFCLYNGLLLKQLQSFSTLPHRNFWWYWSRSDRCLLFSVIFDLFTNHAKVSSPTAPVPYSYTIISCEENYMRVNFAYETACDPSKTCGPAAGVTYSMFNDAKNSQCNQFCAYIPIINCGK